MIRRLIKSANQVLDPDMRKHYLVRRLAALDDPVVAEVIHTIQLRALRGDGAAGTLVASGIDAGLILQKLGRLRVGRIYHEAARRKFDTVCNLFRSLKPVQSPEGNEDAFLKYGLPALTVGECKAAARNTDPILLDRVGFDTNPLVIRQLLLNSRLIEKMVVAITARRPNRPEILEEIFRSTKWRNRPEVRVALVRNPYTAPHIAMALLPLLTGPELRDVTFDGSVHEEVRQTAETLLVAKNAADDNEAGESAETKN